LAHLEVITHGTPSRWDWIKRSLRLGPYHLKDPKLAEIFGGRPSFSGVSVNEHTALNYAAVWAAVTLIAGDVGSLPLHFYKRLKDGGKERYTDHPLYYLLHDAPNPEMSSMIFRETLQAHLLTWGNAYAEIERDSAGRVRALWPLLPPQVTPYREGQRLKYRVTGVNGPDVLFESNDILHVPGLSWDGVMGYSPIRQARESLGLLAASERFGSTFFGNGTTFGGVLQHPKTLGDKAAKNLRDSINGMHQGADKAHRFLIAEEGMTYTRLGIPPNEAQFLETRKFQITEIARWFNLPVHKLREMDNSSVRANIEQEALDYYQSTLRPWLVRWEQEINRKLVSAREYRIQFAEFLLDGVLRGDMQSRYNAYAVARQWGWLNVDEIRERENLNPLPNGEGTKYLSPMNMTPADRLDEVIDKQVAPDPKPVVEAPASKSDEDDDAERVQQRETIQRLQAVIDTLSVRGREHDDALAAKQAEMDGLRAQIAEQQALRQAAEAVRDTAREDFHSTQTLLEEERKAHAAAVVALGEQGASAEQAQAQQQTLRGQIDTLTAELMHERARLAELQANVATVTTERDTLSVEVTRWSEACAEANQKAEAADRAWVRERHECVSAQEREAERLVALGEQEQRAETAETALAAARAEIVTQKDAHAARLTALITANRAVMVDAVGRLVRREAEKARSKRATPQKLRAWAESFYEDHEIDLWREALQPVVAVHLALVQSPESPEDVTRALVMSHMDVSKRQIGAVADSDPQDYQRALDQTLNRWETSRAAAVADVFVREEIAHVRSY
jgi:HK97 family phage portal protein